MSLRVEPTRLGVLVYQCRLCGKQDRSTHVPNTTVAIASILTDGETPQAWGGVTMGLHDAHHCRPGVTGISDLIGAEEDKR